MAEKRTRTKRAGVNGKRRPRLAVVKFASCDGCQLSILNLEDDLLTLGESLEIAYFPEASSRFGKGPYDITLVEGSIATPDALGHVERIRQQSRFLITIGACATAGGIQSLRNWSSVDAFVQAVYPDREYIQSLSTSTPISEHVRVDFEIWGCPIDKGQLLKVITDLLHGVDPRLPNHSVCLECKRQGNVCVLVAKGMPCMGPVTRTGCGAICPGMGRECYACFGPAEGAPRQPGRPPNTSSLARHFHHEFHLSRKDIVGRFRGINGYVKSFREESNAWEEE